MQHTLAAVLLGVGLGLSVTEARATETGGETSSKARPVGLSLELGGRALLYSYTVDYQVNSKLRVGLGYASARNLDLLVIEFERLRSLPLFADYTFYRSSSGRGSWFVGAGVTLISGEVVPGALFDGMADASDAEPFDGYFVPAGLGWEYRGNGGFLFRVAMYGAYLDLNAPGSASSEKAFVPTFGYNFGYAF